MPSIRPKLLTHTRSDTFLLMCARYITKLKGPEILVVCKYPQGAWTDMVPKHLWSILALQNASNPAHYEFVKPSLSGTGNSKMSSFLNVHMGNFGQLALLGICDMLYCTESVNQSQVFVQSKQYAKQQYAKQQYAKQQYAQHHASCCTSRGTYPSTKNSGQHPANIFFTFITPLQSQDVYAIACSCPEDHRNY